MAIKPCPLMGSTECWTIWNCLPGSRCDHQKPQPKTSSSTFFPFLCSTQASRICLAACEPPITGPGQGAHTHRAASSAPSGIKNSQSLTNTECQCCPKPRCFPWPYSLTEKPPKPCCRQMGLLNDFTALLSDNGFF